jgi:serine/threonine protein kinase
MKGNLQTNTCDADRLESYLNGELSEMQELEFTAHLDQCEPCRRSLELRAADPEAWSEAEQLLKPLTLDAEQLAPQRSQATQIQQVLDALAPTDDPAMLGRLGGYEVSGVVGAGGMGVVLKAVDKSLDRTVAIKVLSPHLATSGAARKRFAREAKAAAAVLHPNVIAIHSVSNDETLPYLVMPYVRGASLQKRLDVEGPLALTEILRIGSQIAAGLSAAHAQGLVHRDIKPANILLEDGIERVAITDFGLARAVDDATITRSGVIAGTPQYMSPEQARGEPIDQRSDLFSLGSVLYAICTGRPPFRAETTFGVIRRITDDEPTSIREINPDIPDWLCAIVKRLMSKRASDRFESAEEIQELLEQCLAHVQQPDSVPLPESLVPQPSGVGSFFRSHRTGVIAMLGVFGFSLLGTLFWQGTEPPDIAGTWTGDEWGTVVLEEKRPGRYEGTYTETVKDNPGTIRVQWSRIERRFNGTWREGEDRFGKISVRLVDDEIRGGWTTNRKSEINLGTPELADLSWMRLNPNLETNRIGKGAFSQRVPFEVGATYLRGGDRITIDEVRGTADTIKEGNMYEIKGTYRLASRDKATLAAYITDDGTVEKSPQPGTVPMQKTQSVTVKRGEGRFALILYMWHDGKPHVSFYPESRAEGFGHVYFGTGESVLKRGWWENSRSGSTVKTFWLNLQQWLREAGPKSRGACTARRTR